MNEESIPVVKEAGGLDAEHYFASSLEHVLAELRSIDLLIQGQVRRAQPRQADDKFRGLYLSDADIEEILRTPFGGLRSPKPIDAGSISETYRSMRSTIAKGVKESHRRGVRLRLLELCQWFSLTSFDMGCLLICLAPELDPRYGRLFGYIHDDVSRKHPSIELVLNLLCPDLKHKIKMRRRFIKPAPLVTNLLVELYEDGSPKPMTLPGTALSMDRRVAEFLLGADGIDPRTQGVANLVDPAVKLADVIAPEALKNRLQQLNASHASSIVYFHGSDSGMMSHIAEAMCQARGCRLLLVDGARALSSEIPFEKLVVLLVREASLQHAAICWNHFDPLFADDKRGALEALWSRLREFSGAAIFIGQQAWEPYGDLVGRPWLRIEVPRPGVSERRQLWTAALGGSIGPEADIAAIASRFRLTATEIRGASATAQVLAALRTPSQISTEDLYEACRLHSNRSLSTLAHKIKPHFGWEDIILPADRIDQLREICNWLKYRTTVYDAWGFDRKLALGRGLYILFAGPPGTGKTMASDIIARELGLELYKIDLSAMMSKFIGETEKNLAKVFQEAENSNAILFFDEADALFGKRSEVRDSHDRYANIEVSYLLQRMEEHEGVVILATNFRKNMDEAFVRRLHFSVDFPFPGQIDRRRMWENIWPADTPRAADVDLDFVSKRYEISGGNIRNIALGAAFLAANSGGAVDMDHLLHAVRREFQKMGKVSSPGEFGYEARQ